MNRWYCPELMRSLLNMIALAFKFQFYNNIGKKVNKQCCLADSALIVD